MLSNLINKYQRNLQVNPLRTKAVTAFTLFSVGDYVCQTIIKPDRIFQEPRAEVKETKKSDQWDMQRTLRQGFIGGALLSPGIHLFMTRVMSRVHLPRYSRFANIGLRVSLHQACMMPFIQFVLLFCSATLQPLAPEQKAVLGGSPAISTKAAARFENGVSRFQSKWKEGCSASLMYWPIVNAVMYGCVPARFLSLYADVATLCFSTVMSYIAYKQSNPSTKFQPTTKKFNGAAINEFAIEFQAAGSVADSVV